MHENDCAAVALTRAADYTHAAVLGAVRRQMDYLGVRELLRPGTRVLLKPNLLLKRPPGRHTTTHPMVVQCVIEVLRDMGAQDIVIADSPGGPYTKGALQAIYRASGLCEAAAAGARLNEDTGFCEARCESYRACAAFNLINPVGEADLIINLPKVKTHCMTTLSGGVKNLFGCVPGLQKPELHCRFPEVGEFSRMLVDLAACVAPAVTLADGIVSMEGDGPSGGVPRQTGFLAGSRSPFLLDAVLADLLCLGAVPTVTEAGARGLAPAAGEIRLVGDAVAPIGDFKKPRTKRADFLDRLPAPLRPAAERVVAGVARPRPQVSQKACVGCGKCAESCPVHAITLAGGKARIEAGACIRCFCCHEMCPAGAVRIRRLPFFSL